MDRLANKGSHPNEEKEKMGLWKNPLHDDER